jgi:hypothetical protein
MKQHEVINRNATITLVISKDRLIELSRKFKPKQNRSRYWHTISIRKWPLANPDLLQSATTSEHPAGRKIGKELAINRGGGRFVTISAARVLKRDGGSGNQKMVMSLMCKKINK